MDLKSSSLKEFIEKIKYNERNPKDLEALELLSDKSTNPQILLKKSTLLYRSRVVTDMKEIGKSKNFYGYNKKDSFVPPAEKTRDLRANYRYIPYLYCANHPYIALAEVRPQLGASVSVATIKTREPIKLLDFTAQEKPPGMSEEKEKLFSDLSTLYSTPVTNDDTILEYIPTQFIAEYVKSKQYDGIAYSSSLVPEMNNEHPERYNVVIFNYDKCFVQKSNLITISGIIVGGEQNDEDPQKLDLESFTEEKLKEI